ncbi:hypothetical protein SMICM304S_09838 [Streptomyces microflavus]
MTPTATYRLQLQPDFPFPAAEKAVPYLAALGVSHLHLSPVLEAVPGSRHGYDVVDHSRVREELGGEEGLRSLAATAREHGLGLVLDIVPNHMAAVPRHNRQLWEVLREGRASPYARWFDIDWAAGGDKVLLPVLAGPLGGELDAFSVDVGEDGEVLRYGEQEFPLRAGTADLPLPELLDAQHYRLAWWRLARTELNYRRFFTVSELIGVRVEHPEVFDATHSKVLELLRDGVLDGLRIDHPDGLADPAAYLRQLNEATGGRWTVVEKILTGDEPLPAGWAVAGTTGYDALHRIDGLFTDPDGAAELLGRYREFAGPPGDRGGYWKATVRRAAYRVATHELASETAWLTRLAASVCAGDPALRDHAPSAQRMRGIAVSRARSPCSASSRPSRAAGQPAGPVSSGSASARSGSKRSGAANRAGSRPAAPMRQATGAPAGSMPPLTRTSVRVRRSTIWTGGSRRSVSVQARPSNIPAPAPEPATAASRSGSSSMFARNEARALSRSPVCRAQSPVPPPGRWWAAGRGGAFRSG